MELLGQEGIEESVLVEQCRVPPYLFRIVTSRIPHDHPPESGEVAVELQNSGGRVMSLLQHPRMASMDRE